MNGQLCGTSLTGEMLKLALAEVLLEAAEDLSAVSAESIGEGEGFMSNILRVTLSWKNTIKNVDLPRSVIVKVPTLERVAKLFKDDPELTEEKIESSVQLDEMFRRESAAYKMLSKELPELPLTRCYCSWDKENNAMSLLVLQDLSNVARTGDLVSGLTEDQLLNCADAIAKLQAWSLVTKHDWKSFAPSESTLHKLNEHPEPVLAEMEKLIEKYPKHFGSLNLKDIAAFMEDKEAFTKHFMSYREVMPDVLVHGDYRASNMLFKIDSGINTASSQLAAIIDWQMAHQGSFAEDICYLMIFSVNIGLRRSKMKNVVRYYFQQMKTLVPSIMDSISFDSVWHIFEKTLPWITLFFAPFIVKVVLPACKNEPAAESLILTSISEEYKDAVRFFNI